MYFVRKKGGGVVLLAPVPGPLSIATGTVIVEVLVGSNTVLPRCFPQKRPGVRADFLHVKKKKKKESMYLNILKVNCIFWN